MDRRYPWLCRIESAPLDPWSLALARRVQRQVEGRTHASVCYDRRSGGSLYMFLGNPQRGITSLPMPGPSRPSITDADIDDAVRYIQLGTMPAERKDRLLAQAQARETDMAREADEREAAARRPELIDKLRRRRNRRGMGSHFRPSAVVDGLAQAKGGR